MIDRFLELFREPRKEPAPEEKPREPEVAKPEAEPVRPSAAEQGISALKPSDFIGEDFGKLGVGIEKPDLEIREIDPHAIERMAERGVSLNDLTRYRGSSLDRPPAVARQSILPFGLGCGRP
ncbi:MAG: hypothetical protein WBE80_04850 [Methylocella sp.]